MCRRIEIELSTNHGLNRVKQDRVFYKSLKTCLVISIRNVSVVKNSLCTFYVMSLHANYLVSYPSNTLFVWLSFQMAEEEETREVLFPDWEGTDKTGLTIEKTGGEFFVKEVKGESPAARSGKVYEGRIILFFLKSASITLCMSHLHAD